MTPADLIKRARERLTRCGAPADEELIAALADALERTTAAAQAWAADMLAAAKRAGIRYDEYPLQAITRALAERDTAIKRAEDAEARVRELEATLAGVERSLEEAWARTRVECGDLKGTP